MTRERTKVVQIGNVKIGGGNPIAIQSMTNTKTEDVDATVAQIHALEKAGCEIIRLRCADDRSGGSTWKNQEADSYSIGGGHSF